MADHEAVQPTAAEAGISEVSLSDAAPEAPEDSAMEQVSTGKEGGTAGNGSVKRDQSHSEAEQRHSSATPEVLASQDNPPALNVTSGSTDSKAAFSQHRHSRSRSVNLATFGNSAGSSSSSKSSSSLASWDTPFEARPSNSSPHNPSGSTERGAVSGEMVPQLLGASPTSSAASHSPDSPSTPSAASASNPVSAPQRSFSRSPELKRPSHFPQDRTYLTPGGSPLDASHHPSASGSSSRSRNASPARMYALPPSPRLQAFGSNRQRRTSASSSGSNGGPIGEEASGSHSGSSPPPLLHRGTSPGPLPASPRSAALPLPVNPDPDHPYDSVWPSASTPSPSSSPRGREMGSLHPWMLSREGSNSPILRPTARVGSPVGILPASRHLRAPAPGSSPILGKGPHFGKGHHRSLSGSSVGNKTNNHHHSFSSSSSSSNASSSSSAASPSTSPARDSPIANFLANADAHERSSAAASPPISPEQAHNPATDGDSAPLPRPSTVPQALLKPATSSVKIDAQHAHSYAHAGEAVEQVRSSDSDLAERRLASRPAPLLLHQVNSPDKTPDERSSPFVDLQRSPAASPVSPSRSAALSESPPKTRSFIGMPPRSGYDLSDDPDDVGSEDGASVSSGKDSASTVDEDDRYMEEGEQQAAEDDEEAGEEAQSIGQTGDSDDPNDDQIGLRSAPDEEDDDSAIQGAAREGRPIEDVRETEQRSGDGNGLQDDQGAHQGLLSGQRPTLPKRPSLTRNSGVPSAPTPPPSHPLMYFEDTDGTQSDAARKFEADSSGTEGDGVNGDDHLTFQDTVVPDRVELEGPDANEQPNAAAASAAVAAEMEQPEESLSTLERIFLFAKSEMTYHRVIVSRSLPGWIREVELSEAVEYVIALLNGLATDEPDVCAAFAMELHHILWHFYQNCPLVELEEADAPESQGNTDKSEAERAVRPRIAVSIFTPLMCALLLNQHSLVANTAQTSIVSFCRRLRGLPPIPDESSLSDQEGGLNCLVTHAEGREGEQVEYEPYDFDERAKAAVLAELLDHVALAMGKPSERAPSEADQQDSQHGELEDNRSTERADDETMATANDEAEGTESSSAESRPVANGNKQADDRMATQADDNDSAWDAAMQEESQEIDVWRKAGSPFDSSSPVFSSHDRADVDEEAAVGRMTSIGLLGALSAEDAIASDVVRSRFVPELITLRQDPAFYVRKEAAVALGPISRHLSDEDVQNELLALFDAFCEDKIWHVRQAACSSLPAIFKKVKGDQRRTKVVSLLRSFASDVSRNVRTAALEIIGEVIFLFHGEAAGVPEELCRFFLGEPFDGDDNSMAQQSETTGDEPTPSPGSGSFLFADFGFGAAMNGTSHARKESHWGADFLQFNDPERPLVVAYNFPAVLLTLGGDAWPRLRALHADLISNGSDKVRQSLAASLHEVAKLITSEAAEQDIVPLFERIMLTDASHEVKAAALENAHIILAQVSKTVALQMLSRLRDMWSQTLSYSWRLRESLASQIPQLAQLLVLDDEEGSLMSIMQTALSDPISSVRQAGVKAAPSLYHNFAEHDQTVADGVLGMLADMGESSAYRVRVGFLLAAEALVASRIQRSSFQLIVLPRLVSLAEDSVVDVRLALARVVYGMCQHDELFASQQSRTPEVLHLVRTLVRDASTDVRNRIVELLDPEDPVLRLSPQIAQQGRRNLTLGPADGGSHRPEVSSFSMDYESGSEPFAMDEDGEGEADDDQVQHMGNRVDLDERGRQNHDVLMSEHDADSDMEMVNIDDAAELPEVGGAGVDGSPVHGDDSSGENPLGDCHSSFDTFDSDSDPPHHLLNVGGDTEDEDSFEREFNTGASFLRGAAPSGWLSSPGNDQEAIGSSLLSLTSPERTRDSWVEETNGVHDALAQGPNGLPTLRTGIDSSSPSQSEKDGSVQSLPLARKSGPKRLSSYSGVSADAATDGRLATSGASDPFLSFVSGEMGNGSPGRQD